MPWQHLTARYHTGSIQKSKREIFGQADRMHFSIPSEGSQIRFEYQGIIFILTKISRLFF